MTFRTRWTGVLVALLILTGCTVPCEQGPLVSARGITDAPAEDGSGDAELAITVREGRGGPPIAGAGVVVHWSENKVEHHEDEDIPPEAGEPGEPVPPNATAATPEPRTTLTLMTSEDGMARAHVPDGQIVGITAAKEGYTEEWIGYVPASSSATSELTLPLYHQHREGWINDTLEPAGASTGAITGSERVWDDHEVDLGPDPADHMARIVSLEAPLTWENEPTASGDLGIGVDESPGDPRVFHDRDDNAEWGQQTEHLSMDRHDLESYRLTSASSLLLGAGTETAYAAPEGLDHALAWEATFDRSAADSDGCLYVMPPPEDDRSGNPGASADGEEIPAPGAAAGLTVLAVLAVVCARRR